MINLALNEEQQLIIDSVQGTLGRLEGQQLTAAQLWSELAGQGMFGLSLDEAELGAGLSIVEEALLAYEVGRFLTRSGVVATAAAAIVDSSSSEKTVSGELIVGFGVRSEPSKTDCWLIDAADATHILLKDGLSWALVPASGFSDRSEVESVDGTPLEVATIGSDISGIAKGGEVLLRIELLICAALCGLADNAKDMSVEYAGIREQFGRPIGSFQAVAHHCADAAMRLEAARAQLFLAAVSVRDGAPDAELQVAAAGRIADDAAFRNATINIRIHGGMGYSSETGADMILKRTLTYRRLSVGDHWRRKKLL